MLKLLALGLLLAARSQAAIVAQDFEYKDGDQALLGYLAYDASKSKAPGILIAHSWMGVSDYEKGRARQLAELGYAVLAADIYGKGVRPSNADEAGKQAGLYKGDRPLMRKRMLAALKALKGLKQVDANNTAALGYCFGGTAVLELGRSGADIQGLISFHGGLDNPAPVKGKKIKARVLVLQGADDPWVSKKEIEDLEKEMKASNADYTFTSYSGAVHAFTMKSAGSDNSKGAAYNEKADKRSFIALQNFLNELFSKK